MQYNKKIILGRLHISISQGSSTALWGRFGGGWNWKFGIQVGGRTCILSLLVLDVRISIK